MQPNILKFFHIYKKTKVNYLSYFCLFLYNIFLNYICFKYFIRLYILLINYLYTKNSNNNCSNLLKNILFY